MRDGRQVSESLGLRVTKRDRDRVARLAAQVRGVRLAALCRELFLLGLERAEEIGPSRFMVSTGPAPEQGGQA